MNVLLTSVPFFYIVILNINCHLYHCLTLTQYSKCIINISIVIINIVAVFVSNNNKQEKTKKNIKKNSLWPFDNSSTGTNSLYSKSAVSISSSVGILLQHSLISGCRSLLSHRDWAKRRKRRTKTFVFKKRPRETFFRT